MVSATTDFLVAGVMDVGASSTLDATGLMVSVGGGLTDPGDGITAQTIRLVGIPSVLPATIANDVLVDSNVNLPNDVTILADLVVQDQLFFGGSTLVVSGNVDVTGATGRIYMNNAADVFDVGGDLTLDGATTSGATGQRFFNLSINTATDVTFASDAVVTGTLGSGNVTLIQGGGSAVMDVRGALNVDGTTFNGLPIRLETSRGAASHAFDNVTFQAMGPTDTQWFVRMPGSVSLSTSNVTFWQTPTTGYYLDAGSSNGVAYTILMNSSDPVDGSAFELTDVFVTISWVP